MRLILGLSKELELGSESDHLTPASHPQTVITEQQSRGPVRVTLSQAFFQVPT